MAEGPILLQKDNTFTKLFVGGLPYHTTDETLHAYFIQFGEIEEAVVIHDRLTSKSKGYGFVTMKDKEGAERACANPNPVIDGRKANVNLAYLGAKAKGGHSQPTSPLGIFPLGRSESPNALFSLPTHSPPHALQMAPGFFLPSPPPPHFFPADGPPFSPPPPLLNPMFYPPFFNGSCPPFGYIPPPTGPHNHQLMPQFVPFNAAN